MSNDEFLERLERILKSAEAKADRRYRIAETAEVEILVPRPELKEFDAVVVDDGWSPTVLVKRKEETGRVQQEKSAELNMMLSSIYQTAIWQVEELVAEFKQVSKE